MDEVVIKQKHPNPLEGWTYLDTLPNNGYPAILWDHYGMGVRVMSAVEVSDPKVGPEYHVSVSYEGRARCSRHQAAWVLKQFDMEGATEDNHVPGGICRNFFKPVADPLVGMECKCVDEETAIKEDGGEYIWRSEE